MDANGAFFFGLVFFQAVVEGSDGATYVKFLALVAGDFVYAIPNKALVTPEGTVFSFAFIRLVFTLQGVSEGVYGMLCLRYAANSEASSKQVLFQLFANLFVCLSLSITHQQTFNGSNFCTFQ